MKKNLVTIFATFILSVLVGGQYALASQKPLMIIRFNQPRVFYQQPLYTAASRAVSVKPDVRFTIISYAPVAGDAARDVKLRQQADSHLREIISAFAEMGVPSSQVTTRRMQSGEIAHEEVHIYVD